MVNSNCAPGGNGPEKFELILVSAGPSVVVVHEAVLLFVAAGCSLGPLIETLFTSGTFWPTLLFTVVVSTIVPLAPAAKPPGKFQVKTCPFTVFGCGEALAAVLVKLSPAGKVSLTTTVPVSPFMPMLL